MNGARVLVVDTHGDSATFLCRLLDAAGFQTASTPRAEVALDSVLTEGVATVLVAHAGELGATVDVLRSARSRPEPVVNGVGLVALVDDEAAMEVVLAAGADAVLVRPVEAEQLVETVTEVCATTPEARAGRRRAGS